MCNVWMVICHHAAVSNSLNAGVNFLPTAGRLEAGRHSVNTATIQEGGGEAVPSLYIARQNLDLKPIFYY